MSLSKRYPAVLHLYSAGWLAGWRSGARARECGRACGYAGGFATGHLLLSARLQCPHGPLRLTLGQLTNQVIILNAPKPLATRNSFQDASCSGKKPNVLSSELPLCLTEAKQNLEWAQCEQRCDVPSSKKVTNRLNRRMQSFISLMNLHSTQLSQLG